jgi:acylphosphatase
VLEGEPNAVESVVRLCRKGPRSAAVTGVDLFEERPEGLSGFDVR